MNYPYGPYGAALSPYDMNAINLVQAYRAMDIKDKQVAQKDPSESASNDLITERIKSDIHTLQQICQGCPSDCKEYRKKFENIEQRLDEIRLQSDSERSHGLLHKIDNILNDIRALQTSYTGILESQNLSNTMAGVVDTTREQVDIMKKDIDQLKARNVDSIFNERVKKIENAIKPIEKKLSHGFITPELNDVAMRLDGLTSDFDHMIGRVDDMEVARSKTPSGVPIETPSHCDLPSKILQYKNGGIVTLPYEYLSEIVKTQARHHTIHTGETLDISQPAIIIKLLLEYIREGIEEAIQRKEMNPFPTRIQDLIDIGDIAQNKDIIYEFLRIVDKSPGGSITKYPCEFLDFLYQFETSETGEQVLKALVARRL